VLEAADFRMTLADCVCMIEDDRPSASNYGPWGLPHAAVVRMQQGCRSYSGSLTVYRGERGALVPRGADARRYAVGVLHLSCLATVGPHTMTSQPELQVSAEKQASLEKVTAKKIAPKVKNSIWDTSTDPLPTQ